MSPSEARVIEIELSAGARIRVERTNDTVVIRQGERWSQALTLEEAWELAESLDALSTMAPSAD